MRYLFIGEKRSKKAIEMNVTWKDGKLAAKQLFEALEYCGINPKECTFYNAFDGGHQKKIFLSYGYPYQFVAMGNKAAKWLRQNGMENFIQIVHPAARGSIRKKQNYFEHVKTALNNAKNL